MGQWPRGWTWAWSRALGPRMASRRGRRWGELGPLVRRGHLETICPPPHLFSFQGGFKLEPWQDSSGPSWGGLGMTDQERISEPDGSRKTKEWIPPKYEILI